MPYRGSYEQNTNNTSNASWLGFQEVALTDVVDKSADYPNMELFLEIHFRNLGSQFPWKYNLIGSFDRDENGKIEGTSGLLKRILYFTDAIGFDGGVNTEGKWVDKDDKEIEDIAALINAKFTEPNYGKDEDDPNYKYYIFVYMRWDDKNQRAFKTVCPKIVHNDNKGRKDLEDYIRYMKANKFIVEHDDTKNAMSNGDMSSTTAGNTFSRF